MRPESLSSSMTCVIRKSFEVGSTQNIACVGWPMGNTRKVERRASISLRVWTLSWADPFRITCNTFALGYPAENAASNLVEFVGCNRVRILARTSTSPHVGSYLSIEFCAPQYGLDCFFALIAALDTCCSLIASGSPVICSPVDPVVPMQDSITHVLQNRFQVCQTRDRRPSNKHSSRNEKREDASRTGLAAAKSVQCWDKESNSRSSSAQTRSRAMALTQTGLEVLRKAISLALSAALRGSRLRMLLSRTHRTRSCPFPHGQPLASSVERGRGPGRVRTPQ